MNLELEALRAEMAEMRAEITAARQAAGSEPAKKKSNGKTVEMPCKKIIDARGQRMHRRHCKKGCEPQE